VTLALALAGGLLTGCGNDEPSTDGVASTGKKAAAAASPSASTADDPAKLAKCLRDNGLDVKDPEPGTGEVTLPEPGPALDAAMNKCAQYGTGMSKATGVDVDPNDPKVQERRLKFASCMRGEGVDWPDPKPNQDSMSIQMTPQMRAAMEKCDKQLPVGGN
jgi:hypothetical protein